MKIIYDPIAETLIGIAIVRGASPASIQRMRRQLDRHYVELEWEACAKWCMAL